MISIQVILLLLLVLAQHPLLTFVHGCQGEIGNLTCTGSNQDGSLQDGIIYINVKLYPLATSSNTSQIYYQSILNSLHLSSKNKIYKLNR